MTRDNLNRINNLRIIKIGRLERELAAERTINRALSKLAFAPKQDPYALAAVKRAYRMKEKLALRAGG